ncbi:hypothetical protein [Mesorhizobium sp. M4B.F.Ca.ET.058.02.1.1]|uniref:hypothetical protein n=1 Tax=Mesorhizobium sp. M4B.F.Ca.ET.058.02.1.1 TaxID=2493675 RepID=UPI000F751401|nr:hypothetical protein [Mesorhizobium sp. M4B.F.Ca.ET.058.02.1.1]AZO51247.1 hypothetical protein EJ073_28615 [Mesorhizobium sp. M4B.F.Ca.ET.058.02.1.1]
MTAYVYIIAMSAPFADTTDYFGEFLQHAMWRPRAAVREPMSAFEDGIRFRSESLAQIAELDADLNAWIAEGARVKAHLWESFRPGEESGVGAEFLTGMIDAYEASRLKEAMDLARLKKAFKRDQKAATRISSNAGRILKEVDDRLLAYFERALAARLDYALFMRAHRAELDPDAHGGPTFDNPEALEKYLLGVVAE